MQTQQSSPNATIRYSEFNIHFSVQRTAGYIIDNVFENDVAALASWKSASHVEVPPKKKPKPPTPTPPDNGNDDPTP